MINAWQNVTVDYILKSMLLCKQFRMNLTCVHSACEDYIDPEMRDTWCQPESQMVYQPFPELEHFTDNTSDVVGRFLRNLHDCPYETVSGIFKFTVCLCEYITLDCEKVSQFKTVIWVKIRSNLFSPYLPGWYDCWEEWQEKTQIQAPQGTLGMPNDFVIGEVTGCGDCFFDWVNEWVRYCWWTVWCEIIKTILAWLCRR